MHTEAADFLGGLRPARRRQGDDDSDVSMHSTYLHARTCTTHTSTHVRTTHTQVQTHTDTTHMQAHIYIYIHRLHTQRTRKHIHKQHTYILLYYIQEESEAKLFEWSDGILVHAMLEGSCLLIDEISLADDAVLERLNSVLEPERTLLVAEKGCSSTSQPYLSRAQEGFVLMATMNPGGDYGKKEVKCIH